MQCDWIFAGAGCCSSRNSSPVGGCAQSMCNVMENRHGHGTMLSIIPRPILIYEILFLYQQLQNTAILIVYDWKIGGWDGTVCTATHHRLDGLGLKIHCKTFHTHPDQSQGPPSLLYNEYQESFFPRGTAVRVWHWPLPSSARIEHGYSCTSTSPLCLLGM
jgi:hypothetical protein